MHLFRGRAVVAEKNLRLAVLAAERPSSNEDFPVNINHSSKPRTSLSVSGQTPSVLAEEVQHGGIEMQRQAVARFHPSLAGKDGDKLLSTCVGVDDGLRAQFLDEEDAGVQLARVSPIGKGDVLRADADADPLAD